MKIVFSVVLVLIVLVLVRLQLEIVDLATTSSTVLELLDKEINQATDRCANSANKVRDDLEERIAVVEHDIDSIRYLMGHPRR